MPPLYQIRLIRLASPAPANPEPAEAVGVVVAPHGHRTRLPHVGVVHARSYVPVPAVEVEEPAPRRDLDHLHEPGARQPQQGGVATRAAARPEAEQRQQPRVEPRPPAAADRHRAEGALAVTIRAQLFSQFCSVNGASGPAPLVVFGSDSSAEMAALVGLVKGLGEAGLEPDDDALDTISERVGFRVRRKAAAPSFPSAPFSLHALSAPAPQPPRGDSAGDLAAAFAGRYAPLRKINAESASSAECLRRCRDWLAEHENSASAEILSDAMAAYAMRGPSAVTLTVDVNGMKHGDNTGRFIGNGGDDAPSKKPDQGAQDSGYDAGHRAKIGESGDWRSLGLPAMRNIPPDPPIVFNKEADALQRIKKGETVANPFGEVLKIDERSLGHIAKKGRSPQQLSDKLRSLDGAKDTVKHPHEIWLGDNNRRIYVRITSESNGRRVVNAVEQSPDLLLSWHTSPYSYDHYRHGVLQWLRE